MSDSDTTTASVEVDEGTAIVIVKINVNGEQTAVYLNPSEARDLGTAIVEAACIAAFSYKEGLN